MAFTEDFDIYFADFGVDAVYRPAFGPEKNIKVIFDAQYRDALDVESSGPAATCKTSDVAEARHNETLVINSKEYYITGKEPDGTGMTILKLTEKA